MKKFFLSLDLEEWYHLEYFQHLIEEKDRVDIFINRLNNFFNLLDEYNIKITVFVLAELAQKHPQIIKDIVERGHEIACHGLNHGLLNEKTNDQFYTEIKQAKAILEDISGQKILGYRAPCFSLDDYKLPVLIELGFKYDSSYIKFSQHDLYKMMNLNGFERVEDLIYKKKDFFEFEIPTFKINKFNLPISGGGYFRLMPIKIYTWIFKQFGKKCQNFVFYIHPFELDPVKVNIPKVSKATLFRYSIGRDKVLPNLKVLIESCMKNDYIFKRMVDYFE